MQFANNDIRDALAGLPELPTSISDWIVETGTDSTDDPAVWVWAILPDDKVDFKTRIEIRDRVLDFIREESDTPL